MRKLIINGYIADISDGEEIALSRESNAIFDFQNKRANLSSKIKLPHTEQNNKIFGNANDMSAVLRYDDINKRNYYRVKYIQDHQEIIVDGQGILNNAKEQYEFTIYWGNVNIKDRLGDATLRDLNLSDLNHDYSVANTILREGTFPDTEYFYPLTNNVKDQPMLSGLDSNNAIDVVPLVPAVRLSRILKQITFDFHIFYEGIESIENNTSLIIPCNERPMDIIYSADVDQRRHLGQNVIDTGATNEEKINVTIGDEDEHIIESTGKYLVNYNFNFFLNRLRRGSALRIAVNKFTLEFVVFAELYQNGSWQDFSTFDQVQTAIEQGDTVGSVWGRMQAVWLDSDLSWDISLSNDRIFDFTENDRIRWRCIHKVTDDSTFASGDGFIHNIRIDTGSEFEVGFDKLREGMPVDITKSLPDTKLIDILKWVASITGSLIDFTDGGNTIRFVQLTDFISSLDKAYDISDKIMDVKIEDLHCDLAQNNVMKYDNHDDIPKLYGSGSFEIIDDTLPISQTFYKAPFSTSINEDWRSWHIAEMPIAEYHEEVEDKDGSIDSAGDRILEARIIESEIFYDFYGQVASSTFKKYIASFPGSLIYENIIQVRYREYITVMNDYKFIKARAYLTSKDFRDIDLMKPVFVKQLGAYFLVNKIHNYVEGKLTELHLTMLSYAVRPIVFDPPVPPPPPPPTLLALILTVRENGKVDLDGEVYTTGSYTIYVEYDKEITLKGLPAEGYQFYKWTGDVESSSAEIQVTMDTEKSLEAWFTLPRIKLEDSTGEILTEDGKYIYLE